MRKPSTAVSNNPPLLGRTIALAVILCQGVASSIEVMAEQPDGSQRAEMLQLWLRGTRKSTPPSIVETDHFLLAGEVKEAKLAELGKGLEKTWQTAATPLKLDPMKNPKYKPMVFVLPDERTYKFFVIRLFLRRVEPGERSSLVIEKDKAYLLAAPPERKGDLPIAEELASLTAQYLIRTKHPKSLPDWVVTGFGRATLLRTASARRKAQERLAAATLVARKKRKASDAWSASVPRPEREVIAGLVVYYLAYSGRTKKFPDLLQAFVTTAGRDGRPDTAAAFRKIGVEVQRLNQVWPRWLAIWR